MVKAINPDECPQIIPTSDCCGGTFFQICSFLCLPYFVCFGLLLYMQFNKIKKGK